MKKLGTKGLKTLKVLHVAMAVMWAGGALAMMTTMLLTEVTDVSSMEMRARILKAIDDYLIIYGANGCLLTGIVYGAFTNWGFFKHRWIVLKWILTILMILSGTFAMGPCVDGNVAITDHAAYLQNVTTTVQWGWLQVAMLVVTLILSVWKPRWKVNSTVSSLHRHVNKMPRGSRAND